VRRRAVLALPAVLAVGLPVGLAACGLSERPYEERRQWPLTARRPSSLPPRPGGRVLEVRTLRAAAGLEQRGLQSVQPDGSIRVAFYEEWSVPPAQAAEDSLRRWLADSGLFAAVVAPGTRLVPELVLEGELDALWSVPAQGQEQGQAQAHVAMGITVTAPRLDGPRLVLQRRFAADTPISGTGPAAEVQAQCDALGQILAAIEGALRR
jgi:cholesterol transport system auxiliary component